MEITVLFAFCGTFFLIALSPGLCMTLAMSLGIRIGVRATLPMMAGELVGIALVGAAALGGLSALLLQAPGVFPLAKTVAVAYLLWSAFRTWRTVSGLETASLADISSTNSLVAQGFITSVSNPKAWIFFAALLPPFIDAEKPILIQAAILLTAMVVIEFICLLIYARGGLVLRDYLADRGWGQWLNKVSASLMVVVAMWLLLS